MNQAENFVPKMLKDYKKKKATVETTNARIEALQVLMCEPNLEDYEYYSYSKEMGMPKGSGVSSTVERMVGQRELTQELIKEWIAEDRSRIYFLGLEIKQVEEALKGLTSWEEYVISCKYFENMFWSNIEASFNAQFPQKHDITQERLRQMNREALEKLETILRPFYERFLKVS